MDQALSCSQTQLKNNNNTQSKITETNRCQIEKESTTNYIKKKNTPKQEHSRVQMPNFIPKANGSTHVIVAFTVIETETTGSSQTLTKIHAKENFE